LEITREWLNGQRADFLIQLQGVSDQLLKLQGAISLIDHQIALCDAPEGNENESEAAETTEAAEA
jgi:hypothetical protein